MSGLEFIAGTLFGSALLLSGVYSPAVITSQLSLSNFHMLESFLVASAASAGVVMLADKTGYSPVQVREPRRLRLFSSSAVPFSANVVGGVLQGVGMATTGACPGTVLVQMATGIRSGLYVCAGGIVGGIAFAVLQPHIIGNAPAAASAAGKKSSDNIQVRPASAANTIHSKLGLSTDAILLIYELMCAGMVFGSLALAPKTTSAYLPPPIGGLLIGAAQAATILMTRRTVGVSGAYRDVGSWIVNILKGQKPGALLTRSLVFALGIFAGSLALAARPDLVPQSLASGPSPTSVTAFLGGIAGIFGASLAGGCTSGHGISGMATFSTASFVTVAAMFGGGIAAAKLLS